MSYDACLWFINHEYPTLTPSGQSMHMTLEHHNYSSHQVILCDEGILLASHWHLMGVTSQFCHLAV